MCWNVIHNVMSIFLNIILIRICSHTNFVYLHYVGIVPAGLRSNGIHNMMFTYLNSILIGISFTWQFVLLHCVKIVQVLCVQIWHSQYDVYVPQYDSDGNSYVSHDNLCGCRISMAFMVLLLFIYFIIILTMKLSNDI